MAPRKLTKDEVKTWIEISRSAARRNYQTFRKLLEPNTRLFAVVKSNAYGHGLLLFSKLVDQLGVDGFCVDALIEGLKLRHEGIKKPILVLGPTLPQLLRDAAEGNITVSISNFESLKAFLALKNPPQFHIKVDTGMHRQGFYPEDIPKVTKTLRTSRIQHPSSFTGVYTHFASAKDINYPTYTEQQFAEFQKVIALLERAGFKNLMRHAAATGGTLVNKKYHLDAVRIGIGLYGLPPSRELAVQLTNAHLTPVMAWKTLVSEVKTIKAGEYIGYDLTERMPRAGKIAVLPVGYWHGYPRALSGVGQVLIQGKRAKVLGRVSMDLLVVDATGIAVKGGDHAVLIGKDHGEEMRATEVAERHAASHYELVTRLNPLIHRGLV